MHALVQLFKELLYIYVLGHFIPGDFRSTGISYIFSATSNRVTTNYEYALSGTVVDDEESEGEEGFILSYSFNPTAIDPIDYRRLQFGHVATLIKIADSGVCEL